MADLRLDPSNPVHARAQERLETEPIGWLGSTGRDGFPHSVPVWFLWHEGTVVIFSPPGAAKTRNLQADPRAVFHLEAGHDGEQLHALQGTVELSADPTSVWLERVGDAYLAKYAAGIEALRSTPERFAKEYSVAIVLHPHKLIAW